MATTEAPRTTSEHWRRDKPAFYNFLALQRGPVEGAPPVEGLTGALMSKDLHTGAHTFVLELPAGWKQQTDARDAALEFLTLKGDLALEGDRVGGGAYVHLPQGGGGGELRSENGGLALCWWNPNAPQYPPPYTQNRVLRLRDIPYVVSLPDAHGVMHKSLRLPDPANTPYGDPDGKLCDGPPGGYLRYTYLESGIKAPFEHVHHECFEEIIMLQGDTLLCDEGVMGIGSVVCHPQEWWHGPFASRSGAIVLVHTDAPMGYPWPPRDYPFQEEVVNAYLDEQAWDVPAKHTPFAETPWARYQRNDEFEKWAKTPAAAEFGDEVGQGVASRFRASYTREVQ
jgi:hypothetical protein